MFRPVSGILAAAAIACTTGAAYAQSSPIPDSPVPGFGGRDTRPGSIGGSPASSGSGIGSNVGAGASASPVTNDPPPAAETAQAPPPVKPLIGLSRDIPVTPSR
jgi:hypothetical protein